MANKPKAGGKPSASAALAAAQKAARKAQADVARLSAEVENEDDEDQEGVEAVEGDDDEDQEGADVAEGDDDEEGEDGQTDAQKIASSAEAAANPKAATAAIASGMTFAQFKGQARAQGGGGRRLAGVLGGSPRLGADAKGSGGRDKGLDPSAIYKRRANRARPQST